MSVGGLLSDLLASPSTSGSVPIETPRQWRWQAQGIRTRILRILGPFPDPACALEPQIEASTDTEHYVRHKVRFSSEPGERIPAHLMIPKGLPGPAPAMLCLHQTVAQGKDEPTGLSGDPDLFYAHHLAQRGYVVLAPDHLCAGERLESGLSAYDTAPFYQKHPDWSAVGKTIWDARRALDYLCSLDEVDPGRIGCIGHSLGGTSTVFAAAFDDRIQAAVCSCGLTTFAEDPNRLAWARDQWYIYMPRLRPIFLASQPPPFDFHEVVSLIAPRPFLTSSALNDVCFANTDALAELGVQVSRVYRLLGAQECFASFLHGSGHGFNAEARALAYTWLDRWLKPAAQCPVPQAT